MESYDVAVIGGGPAGYSAALKAAERGAKVALIEAEKPGGACVHHACIPTNILLASTHTFIEARELDVMGVLETGERINFARAAARKDALVQQVAEGIIAALRMRKVIPVKGRASFRDPHTLEVSGADDVWADAIVIATGTRWEPPAISGIPPERVLTADAVQSLPTPPASALILGDGPADTAFALEYATLLAAARSEVTVATTRERLLPGLDAALADVARATLTDLGVNVLEGATILGGEGDSMRVRNGGEDAIVPAEIIVAADPRKPFFEPLQLEAADVFADGCIPVDRSCRTNVPHIFAAGDVTGGVMLTNAAMHMGEVAGANAAGGEAVTRLSRVPHLLHTFPELAWIGLTEEQATAEGYDVSTGVFDLSYNARAVALGARTGMVKVVADRELGEVLGVHLAGPAASEMLAVATAVMQAEIPLADLAAIVFWHPSVSEGLVEAAKRALS
ncbi:MAG TPA: FAD-dependent oxidoreductase [Tepidiformaceae bacterium]|nr:FAD-dependent oxidoreductase [Tepidiformaceae bacterium]